MFRHWNLQPPRPARDASIEALRKKGHNLLDIATIAQALKTPPALARQRISRLVREGVLVRRRAGLYEFRDPAQAPANVPTPAEIAHQLLGARPILATNAAMAAHGFGQLQRDRVEVFTESVSKRMDLGDGWALHPLKPRAKFHTVEMNVPGFGATQAARAEDVILEGLDLPRRIDGGVLRVAAFMGHLRGKLDVAYLVDEATRSWSVIHRLGLLLEIGRLANAEQLAHLRGALATHYELLDPTVDDEYERLRYWMLRVNIPYAKLAEALGAPWPPVE